MTEFCLEYDSIFLEAFTNRVYVDTTISDKSTMSSISRKTIRPTAYNKFLQDPRQAVRTVAANICAYYHLLFYRFSMVPALQGCFQWSSIFWTPIGSGWLQFALLPERKVKRYHPRFDNNIRIQPCDHYEPSSPSWL